MFSSLPKWITYTAAAVFLGIGGVLMVFAVGGMLGFFQEDLPPLPPLEHTGENDDLVESVLGSDIKVFPENTETATFAAGCFWCTEAVFQEEPGVLDAVSGFAGGTSDAPTYDDVARGKTDYREAVQVKYNPNEVTYERLLEVFWESIDAVDEGGQFVDRGFQYTTAVYWHDDVQKEQADLSIIAEQQTYEETIATEILPFTTFTAADEYHQDFYKHSKERYGRYKQGSGREDFWEKREENKEKEDGGVENEENSNDQGENGQEKTEKQEDTEHPEEKRETIDEEVSEGESDGVQSTSYDDGNDVSDDGLEELEALLGDIFGEEGDDEVVKELEGTHEVAVDTVAVGRDPSTFVKPSKKELKQRLSSTQYRITQNDGTETPFTNAYWDNKEEGIYVDIVSGEPLFSSRDKYRSGTGWPSFTQPIGGDTSVMTTHEDTSLWITRTELRSTYADSHLGHLFDDGPASRGGLRYCMNSAGMNFIPYDDMEDLGYGKWKRFVK